MNRINAVLCLLVGLVVMPFLQASEKLPCVLVVGRATSVSLVRDRTGEVGPDGMAIGGYYKVSLKDVRGIDTDAVVPGTLMVQLTATHPDSIPMKRDIYVLLEIRNGKDMQAIYWGIPQQIACVPKEVVASQNVDGLSGFVRYDGAKCTSLGESK